MKKEYDVVIIDSGYSSKLISQKISGHNIVDRSSDIHDTVGHGSAVLNIIYNICPNVSACVIKAFHDIDGLTYDDLCDALQYVIENISCKVLNLSLGFDYVEDHNRLHGLIKQLHQNGVIIVSAFDNSGHMSFPAAYGEVIGVDIDHKNNTYEISYIENGIVNIKVGYRHIKTVDQKGTRIIVQGASFATAYITGLILDYIKNENASSSITDVHSFLKNKSASIFSNKEPTNNSFCESKKIQKAIVFPFNKEMHALAQFEKLLPFKVVGYFDSRISLNRNKAISTVCPHIQNSNIIHSFEEIDWHQEFDTVICGYCQEINRISHYDYLKEIIVKCKQHNKRLYCFENPHKYSSEADNLQFIFPHIDREFFPYDRCGKLYPVNKPVLGVFGTSSKQGKFTLQLALRRCFLNDGYRIGQVSSEPSGYLFGMDFVYPFGYGSAVYLGPVESVAIINNQIERMCMNDVDIILVGGQSGTIVYDYNNLNNYLFGQYVFLVASRPDMVLLCVNPFDEVDYIIKTKNFIESSTEGSVIALILCPIKISSSGKKNEIMNDEEIQLIIESLRKKIQLPVFVNSDTDYPKIYEHIITSCSG